MMEKRKKVILLAITSDYITTAEPVGSRSIVKHYKLGISPATVRNEMADLEESGYLMQPHTSAGRIPSDKGYRFYVDVLMGSYELSAAERRLISERLKKKRQDVESLVSETARLLSELCRTVALVLGPISDTASFRHVEFVPLSDTLVMVILVASPGVVEKNVVEKPEELSERDLEVIANFLNSKLKEKLISEIDGDLLETLAKEIGRYTSLLEGAASFLRRALRRKAEVPVLLDGTSQILIQPEFRDIDRIRHVLALLERKDEIKEVLVAGVNTADVATLIGHENLISSLSQCSMVKATYGMGRNATGTIAVIGPTRMDYPRAIAVVRYMSRALSSAIDSISS